MELDESLFDFEEEQRKAQERANDQVISDMIKEREKGSLGDKIEAEELKYQRYIKAMENGARLTTQRGSNFISKSEDDNGIMVSDRVAEYLLANLKLKEIRSNNVLGTCDYVLAETNTNNPKLEEDQKIWEWTIEQAQAQVDDAINKFGRIGGGLYDELDEHGFYVDADNKVQLKVPAKKESIVREALTQRQLKSPKRYIYEICDHLGWNVPLFTDVAAGGYRLRYLSDSKEEAQEGLNKLLNAAKELNIKVQRPRIVSNEYQPRADIFHELVKKYNLPTKTTQWGGEDHEVVDWDSIFRNKPDNYDAFHDEAYYMTYYFAVVVPRYEASEEELKENYNNEFTIEINNEIYCDDNGEAYHFDSYADAQEFIEENELENTSIVRQHGKAKYEEALTKLTEDTFRTYVKSDTWPELALFINRKINEGAIPPPNTVVKSSRVIENELDFFLIPDYQKGLDAFDQYFYKDRHGVDIEKAYKDFIDWETIDAWGWIDPCKLSRIENKWEASSQAELDKYNAARRYEEDEEDEEEDDEQEWITNFTKFIAKKVEDKVIPPEYSVVKTLGDVMDGAYYWKGVSDYDQAIKDCALCRDDYETFEDCFKEYFLEIVYVEELPHEPFEGQTLGSIIDEWELSSLEEAEADNYGHLDEALDSQLLNQKQLSDNGLATVINTLIKDEWDAIQAYNDAIVTFEAEGKNDLVQVLQDILNEENLHVGQLETLLEQVNGSANSIDTGKAEAEVQLTQNESTENTIEDEEDPEEGMHY